MALESNLKTHIKVDDSTEDALLQDYVDYAIDLAQGQTGKTYNASKPLWKQLVKLSVARFHSHRGENIIGTVKEDPAIQMTIQAIIDRSDYT